MENGVENMMDLELQQKVIEGIKNQIGHSVSRIEGFLVVQIGTNSPPCHIHLSHKESTNGFCPQKAPPSSASPSIMSSPSPVSRKLLTPSSMSRKVNRRKAYLPMKCEGSNSPPLPPPPPAHMPSPASLLPQSLMSTPTSVDGQSTPSTVTSSQSLAVDSDAMGPLNADAIQASMNQVMQPSLPVFPMGPFPTDLHLQSMPFVNTVIPVPQVMGDSTFMATVPQVGPKARIGKTPEQRKIKPKPISGLVGPSTAPYAKPTSGPSKRNPNKEFACNQCTEKFKSLNLLTEHTTLVHLCFRCTTCNSKFTQRSNLQRHSLKHLGFKPFKCAICLKEYYRKDHLVRHIEVSHPGSEPKSSILNVMPSADCLRILEETQAKTLRARLAAQNDEESGRSSAPDTPSASKNLEEESAGPSPSESVNGTNEPTDLTIRAEGGPSELVDEDDEEDEDEPVLFGIDIVDDLIGDDDDLEDDLEDELEDLEMDLDASELDDSQMSGEVKDVPNGTVSGMPVDSAMISLPNTNPQLPECS